MPIRRIGDFYITEDLGIVPSIGIETGKIDSIIQEITRQRFEGVFGCPVFGFKEENLDFLRRLHGLKQVWFWEIDLKNIEAIYSQTKLQYFGIHEKRPAIDFSRLPALVTVVWCPRNKDTGIMTLVKLRSLDIWRWKPKSKTYEGLELPVNLKKIDLNWCNPASLLGIPRLEKLEELQIHYCRNLVSISSLFDIAPNLKKLVIVNCPNLKLGPEKDKIALLKHAYINHKSLASK